MIWKTTFALTMTMLAACRTSENSVAKSAAPDEVRTCDSTASGLTALANFEPEVPTEKKGTEKTVFLMPVLLRGGIPAVVQIDDVPEGISKAYVTVEASDTRALSLEEILDSTVSLNATIDKLVPQPSHTPGPEDLANEKKADAYRNMLTAMKRACSAF
jgi:hypothetical protein